MKDVKEINLENNAPVKEKEFTFRALFIGVFVGLILMALLMYLACVVGLDINVSPVAVMVGIFLIPLVGGKTTKKEVNIMQTCACAVAYSCMALPVEYAAAMFMGYKLKFWEIIITLLLTNIIGISFVSLFRVQYVEDPALPFPQAVLSKTCLDSLGRLTGADSRILFIAAGVGFVFSLLQNLNIIPFLVDFTSYLPSGMTLGILMMPMLIGMGYIIGSKICLIMFVSSLACNVILAPIGTKMGWFANPAVDFSEIQNFNLPIVIAMALFASLIPMIKQRKTFLNAFHCKKISIAKEGEDIPVKGIIMVLVIACVALIAYCSISYKVNPVLMTLFVIMALLFGLVSVRVSAESGLSALIALSIFQMILVYLLTGNAIVAPLITFLSSSISMLAQNTMVNLKIGTMIEASPRKLILTLIIGVVPGILVGTLFFFGLIKVYGMDSTLYSYPLGKMYYSALSGISSGGVSEVFNLGRFAIGGGLGTIFTMFGLPASAIAIAIYLAPGTIIGVAVGGIIRSIIEKMKGKSVAERLANAASGVVIGDALVSITVVFIAFFRA